MSKMKAKAMEQEEKQTLPAKAASNVPATAGSNAYLDVAREESGDSIGQMLKFSKGKWRVGDEQVALDTLFVCHLPQALRGWVKFEGGKCTDRKIGKISDHFPVPDREELGDLDQAKWEKDASGKPRDCWSKQYYLPLVSVDTSELLTFVTGSLGGRRAVADLCNSYGLVASAGKLPIVALGIRTYKHPTFGEIENPKFSISGWDEGGSPAPAPTLQDEMDDSIPF